MLRGIMNKCLGVIPARYASTRAPGKPLTDLAGKTMIERVWEQARKASLISELVVATDDQRIFDCVHAFGGTVMMTRDDHPTGSDRVAEVLHRLRDEGKNFETVINIQGDMPFINPDIIDGAIRVLNESDARCGMSTIAVPILREEEFNRPAAVKVVFNAAHEALYFSRAPIPFIRNPEHVRITEAEPWGYKHMGLYVYRPEVLERYSSLPQCLTEQREQLEQLRALAAGIGIRIFVASRSMLDPGIEVDTPEDIARAVEYLRSKS